MMTSIFGSFLILFLLFICVFVKGILLNPFVSRSSFTFSRKFPSVPLHIICTMFEMILEYSVISSSVCLFGGMSEGGMTGFTFAFKVLA